MKKLYKLIITLLVIGHWSLVIIAPAAAIPNKIINIQGKLTDDHNKIVKSVKQIRVSMVDSNNQSIWISPVITITVNNAGIFNAEFDLSSATGVDFNSPYSLIINVIDDADKVTTLNPQSLTSVPYALNSDKFNGLSSSSFVVLDDFGEIAGELAGNVKKSGDSMSGSLKITGGESDDYGVEASGESGAVKGTWIGDNNFFGVLGGYSYKYGDDVSLPGVYGQHSSYTGAARGGLGVIRNILWSFGVWGKGLTAGGYFSSANGTGVLGKSTGTGGIFGAYNSNSTTDKYYGVAGVSVAGNGVYGEITSDTFSSEWKAGVYGKGGAKTSGVMGYTTTDKDNAAAIVGINPKGYGGDFTGKNGVKINGPLEVSGGIQGKGLHWAEKGITASNFFTKTSIGGYYYHKMIKHIYVTFPYSGYALVQASGIFSNNDESFSQMSAQITDNEYLDPDGKNFIIDGSVAVVGLTNPTGQGFYPSFPFASSRVFGVEGGKSYHFHLIGFLKTTKSDVKFNFDGALNCMFFSRKY